MIKERSWIPPTSALLAFESAARHRNFSRAAEELNTSQSAISRHIAGLEGRLNTRLFERHKRKIRLTEEGDHFFHAVVSGLENIRAGAMAVANAPGGELLTIACTHEVSHLFLLPRFEKLQSAVGEGTRIRVMTYEYDMLEALEEPRVDVIFTYQAAGTEPQNRVVALREAVVPLCSPSFSRANRAVLKQKVAEWGDLPFLRLTKPNQGWATWDDWFARVGAPTAPPSYVSVDNYVYLLEAAAAGRGLALGWRGMIERYLEAGSLVPAAADFLEFDRQFYALLTQRGRNRPAARAGLDFLAETTPE
ncbi:MAG: LysR family transcriptional regulator [Pseudomonadota bacterium]